MAKKLIIGGVVLVVLAVAAVWWLFVREDEPDELGVESVAGSEEGKSSRPSSFDGTWNVQEGGDNEAGFRIEEQFAAGALDHTAVGRSRAVEGSITIAGTQVTEGSFTVDLTELEFVDNPPVGSGQRRVSAMERQGLETNEFPEATFAVTEPIQLDEIPEDDTPVQFEATGDLTLHGVTNPITFTVEAQVRGDSIVVASADPVPVVLADYGIAEPSAPFLAGVSGEGEFEFALLLERAA
jgi:polyisoprenoid-binding protein YceI